MTTIAQTQQQTDPYAPVAAAKKAAALANYSDSSVKAVTLAWEAYTKAVKK
jgi:hypothetical protein